MLAIQTVNEPLGSITHPLAGVSADYFQAGTELFAYVAGMTYSAPTLELLSPRVMTALWAATTFTWLPVMEITTPPALNQPHTAAGFTMKRYHITQNALGQWVQAEWGADRNNPAQVRRAPYQFKGAPPVTLYQATDDIPTISIFPYEGLMWEGFQAVKRGLDVMQVRLEAAAVTGSMERLLRVTEITDRALPRGLRFGL